MYMKTVAALVALPLLAACAPEIESTVYLKDVVAVAAGGDTIGVPAILRVPQGSQDGCNEGLENLIANLATLAPATGKGKCIEKDGDNLAEIETEMVVALRDRPVPDKNLFVLVVDPADEFTYNLSFRLTQNLDEIVKVLATNSDELQAEFDPAKFIFTVTNNSDSVFQVAGNTVFIDAKPALPDMAPVTLQPLSSAEIVFSDVASVYAEDANPYRFATVAETP